MSTTAAEAKETAVEKKPKASKTAVTKKPKAPKTANHPSYFEMIKEALLGLKEKSGSSPYAIAKYMEEKHNAVLPPNFRKILALQLKNSAAKGKLLKIKASFKLSEAGKKDVALKKKKPTTKANAVKKVVVKAKAKAEKAKPKAGKKKVAKKVVAATPVKAGKKRSAPIAKPKQPKSIKSPAAKRAKRATAKA